MGYWGKVVGGVAGLFMGGPFGAVMGAALGHAADQGAIPRFRMPQGFGLNPARIAAMIGGRDQVFAIGVVVLSAKLAKCDGPVVRAEIDAFKRQFRPPPCATSAAYSTRRGTAPTASTRMLNNSATRSLTRGACWRMCWRRCLRSPARTAP